MAADTQPAQRFTADAREHLARMTAATMALERGDAKTAGHVEELLRAAHSLKGDAGFCGLGTIQELTHALEAALEVVRDGQVAPTPEVIDVLLFALDHVTALVDDVEHSSTADISAPLARLLAIQADRAAPRLALSPKSAPMSVSASPCIAAPAEFPLSHHVFDLWPRNAAFLYGVKLDWFQCEHTFQLAPLEVARRLEQAGTVLESRLEPAGPALTEGLPPPPLWYWAILASALEPEHFARQLAIPCAAIVRLESVASRPAAKPAAKPAAQPRPGTAAGSLRIPVGLIDRMMGLAGELVLIRNQARRGLDAAGAPQRQLLRRLDAVTNELQDAALRMRMHPVGALFDRFPRLVRDVARQLGKRIDMQITGTEVELDKTIIEMLADPLTHLVRNCCDHGIEPADERVRAGKPPSGVIRLSARQERGQIVIRVQDDGKGLDRDAIKRKALEQGVRRGDELERLSERQLYDLIFVSGFSTASRVTDLSGRGVGMDVVRTNLEQIGGVVEIDSVPSEGTTFILRLPLTLAIMPCLMVRNGAQRFAIPQRDVEEVALLEADNGKWRIEFGDDEEVLRLRGGLAPVTRLGEVLARREPCTLESRAQIARRRHVAGAERTRGYVAVLKVGSRQFGLAVDEVLGSEEIVVKSLHPLLRALGVYAGSTILGDGSVALILSPDGLARHSGITYRPMRPEAPGTPAGPAAAESQPLLLCRYGPAELLAMPLGAVRRVVAIEPERIERVGERELVNVDGDPINVLRLDRFLTLSPCSETRRMFLILPRHTPHPVGFLAAEVVDTQAQPPELDTQAIRSDGVMGSAIIRGQIALLLDVHRLAEMWAMGEQAARPALPGPGRRRILVVDDTKFFRQLLTLYLEDEGHEVVSAASGSEGVAHLATGPFDLIVSDIEMPDMDGLAFAKYVRQNAGLHLVPMLALTSLSGAEDRRESLEAGFDAHEVKLERGRFLAKVGALVAGGRPKPPGGGGPVDG